MTGPVCNQYPINILDNENSENLSKRLSNLASEKILENIDNIFKIKLYLKIKIIVNLHMQKKSKKKREK